MKHHHLSFFLILLLQLFVIHNSRAYVVCNNTSTCETLIGNGSECRSDGTCSNPLEQGCLFTMMPGWDKKRVCNSDDHLLGLSEGDSCRQTQFSQYPEIRLLTLNWESSILETWVLQIILSEILDVPTTVETGSPNATLNYYHLDQFYDFDAPTELERYERYGKPMEAASSDYEEALMRSHSFSGDCLLADRSPENYEPCGHYVPETWEESLLTTLDHETVLPPEAMGVIGHQSWFTTKFTVDQDPTLMNYIGLQGNNNRRKLAETFLRPTTWKDYCDLVSLDNCTTSDGVASRKPQGPTEEERMFVNGLYTGHFRKTEKNDCDANPNNCSGHIADYPCAWESFVQKQTHHMGIALESDGTEGKRGGYTHSQLTEMWQAANWTKSNLTMMWWTPNPLYEGFLSTDAEMMRVALPPPTQDCVQAREVNDNSQNRCEDEIGDPVEACDYMPVSVQKLISRDLYNWINTPWTNEAVRSPGLVVLDRFAITSLQLAEMYNYAFIHDSPQEAICQWVVDNMDYIHTLIPEAYPRVLQENNHPGALFYLAVVISCLSIAIVLSAGVVLYLQRERRVIQYAQIEFLWFILAGFLCVAIGALCEALPPNDFSCNFIVWFEFLGNTLIFVPLLVKIAAINRLMNAAQKMRRHVVNRKSLRGIVLLIITFVLIYLIAWTSADPNTIKPDYVLTEETTEDHETIVMVSYYCASQTAAWRSIANGWNMLLLIAATVLAFQSRNVREEFNESFPLTFLIYTNLLFIFIHAVMILLSVLTIEMRMTRSTFMLTRSLLASSNEIVNVGIYFVPKFLAKDKTPANQPNRFVSDESSSVIKNASVKGIPARVVKANVHEIKNRLRDVKSNFASGVAVPEEEWECIDRLLEKMSNENGDSCKIIKSAERRNTLHRVSEGLESDDTEKCREEAMGAKL